MVGYLSCVLGIVFNTREGCVASLSMLGIIFDTREGYVASLSMLGIVFNTREGCRSFSFDAGYYFRYP